ncbi:hypothetical protein FM107_05635 [Sphingobacterium sp. JB170]|nr:hypothetical protein FM107_05635 [Sphingobacterium sp. JB170]
MKQAIRYKTSADFLLQKINKIYLLHTLVKRIKNNNTH